jgi:hypothetical protein
MGNGAIEIQILVYPNTAPGEGRRYENSISRCIEVSRLGSLAEMDRITYTLGEMTTATLKAIIDTLDAREQAAKNPPLVDDDEQAPEDEGPVVSANHVDAWA